MILLIIYLSGIVPAYLTMRKGTKMFNDGDYSVDDRAKCLFFSALSWFSFFTGLVLIMACNENNNKPAKW